MRNILQRKGINMDAHDNFGTSPFPNLADLDAVVLEYVLQWRDRFIFKSKGQAPVAVLKEFWEEQKPNLDGVFTGNTLSKV